MVSTKSNRQVGKGAPTTRCTNCQTIFELPGELLESTDTRVRCGECLCIFDARDGLMKTSAADAERELVDTSRTASSKPHNSSTDAAHKNKVAPSNTPRGSDPASLDVTYSDFDLFSEEADLPTLGYLDETRDSPDFDFDSVELGEEEIFSDTLFAHDVTINADLPISEKGYSDAAAEALTQYPPTDVDFTGDTSPEEPLIFKYAEPSHTTSADNHDLDTPASPQQFDLSIGHEANIAREKILASRNTTAQKAERAKAKHGPDASISNTSTKTTNTDNAQGATERFKHRANNGVAPSLSLPPARQALSRAWVWSGGVVLLMVVLIATVIYPRWKQFDQNATLRPIKIAFCNVFQCQVDTRVDIEKLKVLRREVFQAPNRANALMISIAIQNTADFSQRYPVVEARMTDRIGRTVAQRAFKPTDYLTGWRRGDTLQAGETVDIQLTVNDPGNAAEHHILQLRKLRLDCKPTTQSDGRVRWSPDCAEL